MRPIALLAALVALYMLGRRASRTDAGQSPDDTQSAGDYGAMPNSWTFPYRTASEWRN